MHTRHHAPSTIESTTEPLGLLDIETPIRPPAWGQLLSGALDWVVGACAHIHASPGLLMCLLVCGTPRTRQDRDELGEGRVGLS